MGRQRFCHPPGIFSAFLKILFKQVSVLHHDNRQIAFPGGDARILGTGRGELRIGKDGEIAVRLQNGILDLGNVQDVLLPELAEELVQGHPGQPQIALEQPPIVNEQHGLAAEQPPQRAAAQHEPGQHQLHPQHR